MPKEGDLAPEFSLQDQHGTLHTLSMHKGSWILLYFYPKDNTPGCTKEACAIRDEFPAFDSLKAVVLGVSSDTVLSHKRFAESYNLPFSLLADTEKKAIHAYGVWQKKKLMGHTYMGVARTSFLIDPQGTIRKVYERVKPAVHAAEVLTDLKELQK